jgi:hypothetical protein
MEQHGESPAKLDRPKVPYGMVASWSSTATLTLYSEFIKSKQRKGATQARQNNIQKKKRIVFLEPFCIRNMLLAPSRYSILFPEKYIFTHGN